MADSRAAMMDQMPSTDLSSVSPNSGSARKEVSQLGMMNLLNSRFNRVTDTCIPEEEAFRKVDSLLLSLWQQAGSSGQSFFPHEYFYQLILHTEFQEGFQILREHCWVLAAAEKKLPIYVPGWEDSTLGNVFVARCIEGKADMACVKPGLAYMEHLVQWYFETSQRHPIGFFQIGGGIAGDFPICCVPLINQDLEKEVPCWSYFCQITDAVESYGGYSGALPNEKITWGKLRADTPKYVIHSDASIVAPLIFYYVLGR